MHESVRVKPDSRIPQEVRGPRIRGYLLKEGHRQQEEPDSGRNYAGSNCQGAALPKPLEAQLYNCVPRLWAKNYRTQPFASLFPSCPLEWELFCCTIFTMIGQHFWSYEPWYIFHPLSCLWEALCHSGKNHICLINSRKTNEDTKCWLCFPLLPTWKQHRNICIDMFLCGSFLSVCGIL